MSEPTNADIFQFMGKLDQKIDAHTEELRAIKAQTIKTNGRVTALERRNEVADGILAYNKENKVVVVPDPFPKMPNVDFSKIILALITIMGGIITLLTILANRV
jgi:hypothetical protein